MLTNQLEKDDELGLDYPCLKGRCPSCGAESLYRGYNGYVTCSARGCKTPKAAHDLLCGGQHAIPASLTRHRYDGALARIAGNIAAGLVGTPHFQTRDGVINQTEVVAVAVDLARRIVAAVSDRAEPDHA